MSFKALALLMMLPALVACGTTRNTSTVSDGHTHDLMQALHQWSPALTAVNGDSTSDTAIDGPSTATDTLHNPAQAQALALRQSPAVRSILASQGIADAAFRQSTLINNPGFSASAMRAEDSGSWKTEFGLTLGILDWLMLPSRKQLAGAELALARSQALRMLTDELGKVRRAYFAAVAARHVNNQLQQTAEAARLNAELAGQLADAGNLSELERLHYDDVSARQQQALQQSMATAEARLAELKLSAGLGVNEKLDIPAELPDVADSRLTTGALQALLQDDDSFAQLLAQASAQRPETRLLHDKRRALEQELLLQQKRLGMSEIGLGLVIEREPDGSRASGLELDLSLPIFDHGQHQRASALAYLEQVSADQAALQLATAQELETSLHNLLSLTRQALQLRDEDIPRQQRMVELTLQEYNFMLSGPFELIETKQQELETVVRYIAILERYWQEHADLMQRTANTAENFIAGLTTPAAGAPARLPRPREADNHQEHHHD